VVAQMSDIPWILRTKNQDAGKPRSKNQDAKNQRKNSKEIQESKKEYKTKKSKGSTNFGEHLDFYLGIYFVLFCVSLCISSLVLGVLVLGS